MFVDDWKNISRTFERYSNEIENIVDDEMDTNVPWNDNYYYEDDESRIDKTNPMRIVRMRDHVHDVVVFVEDWT